LQGLVQRMRPGVQQAAAGVFLQGLPVPAAGKAVEADFDGHDAPEDARSNHLPHLDKVGCKTRLLKDGQQPPLPLRRGDQRVNLGGAAGERLLAQHVLPGLEALQRDGRMQVARQSVHHEIQIPAGEQVRHVLVGRAAVLALGTLATVGEQVRDGHDLEARVILEVLGVDVPAAAALAHDTDA